MSNDQIVKIQTITMLAWFGNQRRPIDIKLTDDLDTIEKSIKHTYRLRGHDLGAYQLQYYDSDYEKFVDLYPKSLGAFRKLLKKLSLPNAPPKSTKEWLLKIIERSVPDRRSSISKSVTDDTYNFEQEDDTTELPSLDKPLPITTTRSDEIETDQCTAMAEAALPEHTDRDEAEAIEHLTQSQTEQILIPICNEHPCRLRFDCDLAKWQRQQYDKDMNRHCSGSSKTSKTSGVFLHGCARKDPTTILIPSYPVICFEIPENKKQSEWCLLFFILTEPDQHGVQYLHASKGIHSSDTNRERYCGTIVNSQSVNPYSVRLTHQQVNDGKFEIKIKVCNMTDVSGRKRELLRVFARMATSKSFDELIAPSTNSTMDLNLSNEKYHLGCALLCDDMIYDQCVSNGTTAVTSASSKRTSVDSRTSRSSASTNKKFKKA